MSYVRNLVAGWYIEYTPSPLRVEVEPETFTHKWLDPDCIERGCKSLAAPPAAPDSEALAVALSNIGTMSPRLRKLYDDAAAVLRGQSAPPAAQPGWMPIETAPKNGAWMYVWRKHGGFPIRAKYSVEYAWFEDDDANHLYDLTHWLPLPAAPGAAPPAAPAPAAPVPAGWVMAPRGLLRRLIAEALTFDPSLQDKEAIEQAKQLAASPAAPAASQPTPRTADCLMCGHCAATGERVVRPAVPLTDEQKQRIHNETGAGHSLICLVESYIRDIGGSNG